VEPKGWLKTTTKAKISASAGIPKADAILQAAVMECLIPKIKGTTTLQSEGNPLPVYKA
jgi:hypothetical protein